MEAIPLSHQRSAKCDTTDGVAILLATYNGEAYLDEQLRSLVAQTYPDISIIIRDDGSSDRTPEIIDDWLARYPEKITALRNDDKQNLGLVRNFATLMEACEAAYFAFSDQDDIWIPTKIESMLDRLKAVEKKIDQHVPILVHSDLRLVNALGHEIAPSFFEHIGANLPADLRLEHLLFNNVVTGCALIGNRALLDAAMPFPREVEVHDWWLALVAASCGIIETIEWPTVLYRQHGKNVIGAGKPKHRNIWTARHILLRPGLLISRMLRTMRLIQAKGGALLTCLGNKIKPECREYLLALCFPQLENKIAGMTLWQKFRLLVKFLVAYVRAIPLALHWCY